MNRHTVNLASNDQYWKANYYDSGGNRRGKCLGPKSELSRRQAQVLCNRLAADLLMHPGKADVTNVPHLSEFLDTFMAFRTDLRGSTRLLYERTKVYLLAFFAADRRIDQITRAQASAWRAALASGKWSAKKKGITEATVCQHVRNAKVIFNRAVDDDLVMFNPFDRLKGTAPEPDKDWRYVSPEELAKILFACPNIGWRALVGLCRIAGLRRGEALGLKWNDVDWNAHRLTVFATKTGKRRVVPVEPDLFAILEYARKIAGKGQALVADVGPNNLRRDFHIICKKAGLTPWEDCFQVLRRNCETDWAQRFPQYVVSSWIGHNILVSARHYLQVPEQLYREAAAPLSANSDSSAA